jgi:hypothetical protein
MVHKTHALEQQSPDLEGGHIDIVAAKTEQQAVKI